MKAAEYTNFMVCTSFDENEEITKDNFYKKNFNISSNGKIIDIISKEEVNLSDAISLLSGNEEKAKIAIKHIINERLHAINTLISIL